MKIVQLIASIALIANATNMVCAQTQVSGQKSVNPVTTASPPATPMTSAEVLKVYAKEKKVLLKHGPIPNIGMGAMTMEFGITDPTVLKSVKVGDKVRFTADQVKGEYVVTHIETVR